MRIKYSIICLLLCLSIANAQDQNYMLKIPDVVTKTYIGRDYVRLLPGYSFQASANCKMNAKISEVATSNYVNSFLSTDNLSVNTGEMPAINTNLAVGQIPISSSVNPSGAKCYNVPIEIVSGRQGFQPNISLSYNSQVGNGLVGIGWSIGGLSSIQSIGQNIYFDGVNSATGEYSLDGVRLIKTSPIQLDGNGKYKIDYETVQGNTMVTLQGKIVVIASTPFMIIQTFTVLYPNGNVGIFGNLNGATSPSYPIISLTDINGNIIEYSYIPDPSDFKTGSSNEVCNIDEIKYGKCGAKDHFAKIKFEYESRTDTIFEFQSFHTSIYGNRLKTIQTQVNLQPVRTYNLKYTNDDYRIFGRKDTIDVSRLTEIGCSVGELSLNPIKLYYGELVTDGYGEFVLKSIGRKEVALSGENFDLTKVNVMKGKFDSNSQNDGLLTYPKSEIFKNINGFYEFEYPAEFKVKIFNNLTGTTANALTPINAEDGFEGILLANIDGVGSDEIVKINSHFTSCENPYEDPYTIAKEYFTFKTYKVINNTVVLSNTQEYSFGPPSFSISFGEPGFAPDVYHSITTPRQYYSSNFTGNGKTEVLSIPIINSSTSNISQSYNKKIYLVDLSNSNLEPVYSGTPFVVKGESDLVYAMDIDGDGQTEVLLVGSNKTDIYKYNSVNGFQDIGDWDLKSTDYSDRQIMFADLNGDGNIDIIRSAQAPASVGYNTAPSWASNELRVQDNYMRCPKCGYVHVPFSRNYSSQNGAITGPPKYIAKYQDKYVDYKVDPLPDRVVCQWPIKISDTMAETYCPGCQSKIDYPIVDWDGHHCWECGKQLYNDHCFTHGTSIDWSSWKYPRAWGTTFGTWIYQYTNGKSIVLSEELGSVMRDGETKYSIHEAFGDAAPDLIIQQGNGLTEIHPFISRYHRFTNYRITETINLPPSYEFIDVDCGHGGTNMLALGSNKIVSFTFPFNHTRDNMVSLMRNSLGIVEKTDYSQLYDGPNYTLGTTAQFPYTDFEGPMWIVSQSRAMYNKKIIGNTTYNYQGAILHNQGLGFLGFSSIASTDLMSNKVSTTEFDPYKLGAVTKQTSDAGESIFEYNFTVAPNKKMKLLPISKTIKDNLKGNTISVTYPLVDYDDYGNAGREITDFGDGIKTIVVNTYENRLGDVSPTGTITKRFIGLLSNRGITTERNGKAFHKGEGYMYNPNDGKLEYKIETFDAGEYSETEYRYDQTFRGNLLSEIHYNDIYYDNLTTSYTYWDDDKCSLKTKTDPFNRVTTYSYDFSKRLLTGVKDYKDKTVIYGYDDIWRRLNKITRPDETGPDAIITDINPSWNLGSDPRYLIKETNTTTGQPTVSKYVDALGRETRTTIGGFDGAEVYTDKNYDNFGRLFSSSAPYNTGENALFTNYSYDSYDRLENVVTPNGSSTNYSYSGNSVTVNKEGVLTTTVTDPTGKIISSTDNGGTVEYVYRADGQPESINTAGVVTSFEYNDVFYRQTKLVDPSAGTITTTYDDANHAVTQTWNSGKQVTIVTNKYGQPISKTTPDFVSIYGYEKGLPKSMTTNNGSTKVIDYDEFGRLWKLHEVANGKSYDEEYKYELRQLKSITYSPLDFTVNYKYRNGYLYKLEDALGNRLREVNSVNSLGMETNVLLGNGLTTQTNYTPEGLWTNVETTNLAGSSSPIQNMSFDFNRKNGTLNSRSDVTRGLTENFTYGDLLRLKTYGIPTIPQTMAYKANGNIDTKTDVGTYSYGNAYTLSSVNTNSDLTNELNVDYTILSRPTTISNTNGLSATFSYNDDYDRTFMQVMQNGAVTKSKYYLGGGRYEIETEGGVEKQRLYLDGSPYDASVVAEKTSAGTQLYYLHRDYLGSVTQISDNVGNLTAEYSYDAWGRMRNVTNWNVYSASALPNIKFGRGYTGHEHLNQFGVINMNARLYDPLLGRFLAPDAQVSAPEMSNGYNRYIYAYNNPLMFVDLDGEAGDFPGGFDPGGFDPGGFDPGGFDPGGFDNPNFNNSGGYNFGYNSQSGFSMGMGGNYGGYSTGGGMGASIFSFLQYLFSPPSYKYQGRDYSKVSVTPTPYSISNITFKNASGAGASTVYSGGRNRLGANNPSGQGGGVLNGVQTGLDVLGLIPGIGEFFDGANALIYTARGDYVNAGLSAAACIPFAGWAATGGKLANKAYTVYQGVDRATGAVKYVGITSREVTQRAAEHAAKGDAWKALRFDAIPGATNLNRIDARIMEQNLINYNRSIGNGLYNQINSIAPKYWPMYGIQ